MTTTQQQPNNLVREEDLRIVRIIKCGLLTAAFGAAAAALLGHHDAYVIGACALAATNYAAISAVQALDASDEERQRHPSLGTRFKSYLRHPLL